MRSSVLYLSYDGLLDPLGQSQVIPYLKGLRVELGIYVISFEKPSHWAEGTEIQALRSRLGEFSIGWSPCRYHKSPTLLATSWDIAQGVIVGCCLIRHQQPKLIHARSYVAAVIALALKLLFGIKFLFDMRGFWADERVDGGLWESDSLSFKAAKWFERLFLRHADHIVSLTTAGIDAMHGLKQHGTRLPPCTVIPTCADLNRFVPVDRGTDQKIIGYVGTVGTWYLFEPAAYCFAKLAKHDESFRFLIINQGEHKLILDCLQRAQVPMDRVTLKAASFEDMPHYIAQMAASIFFIKPLFSKKASAPTKLAELLGCGVPCLTNTGVGDMAEQLAEQRCGITVSSFDTDALDEGIRSLLELMDEPDIALRCRQTAVRHFSLEEGVRRYAEVYASLGLAPKST